MRMKMKKIKKKKKKKRKKRILGFGMNGCLKVEEDNNLMFLYKKNLIMIFFFLNS